MTSQTFTDTLQISYTASASQWTGCNWQTEFGSRGLNLAGVKSHQARILAEATSGLEAAAWDDAAAYLKQIEVDAQNACRAAAIAVFLAVSGKKDDAVVEIEKAVALESKYREPETWTPLRVLIKSL